MQQMLPQDGAGLTLRQLIFSSLDAKKHR